MFDGTVTGDSVMLVMADEADSDEGPSPNFN